MWGSALRLSYICDWQAVRNPQCSLESVSSVCASGPLIGSYRTHCHCGPQLPPSLLFPVPLLEWGRLLHFMHNPLLLPN